MVKLSINKLQSYASKGAIGATALTMSAIGFSGTAAASSMDSNYGRNHLHKYNQYSLGSMDWNKYHSENHKRHKNDKDHKVSYEKNKKHDYDQNRNRNYFMNYYPVAYKVKSNHYSNYGKNDIHRNSYISYHKQNYKPVRKVVYTSVVYPVVHKPIVYKKPIIHAVSYKQSSPCNHNNYSNNYGNDLHQRVIPTYVGYGGSSNYRPVSQNNYQPSTYGNRDRIFRANSTTVTNNNNVSISNSTSQYARSGNAEVSHNTYGGSAITGDATNTNTSNVSVAISN